MTTQYASAFTSAPEKIVRDTFFSIKDTYQGRVKHTTRGRRHRSRSNATAPQTSTDVTTRRTLHTKSTSKPLSDSTMRSNATSRRA